MDPAFSDDERSGADRPDPGQSGDARSGPVRFDAERADPDRPGDPDRLGGHYSPLVGVGESPADRRRAPARVFAVGALAVLVITLLGAPLGVLWAVLAPDVPVIKTPDGAVLVHPQPEEFIASDGWFSFLALAFGVLVALALWWARPRWRGPGGLLVAVLGALGAGLVAWGLGRRVGLAGYREELATAPVGQTLAKPPDLRAGGFEWLFHYIPTVQGDVLLGAFGAVVVYTLLAGWSNHPDLVPGRAAGEPAGTPTGEVGGTSGGEAAGTPAGQVGGAAGPGAAREVSSGSPERRDLPAAPAPPGPGEAGPVRG